MLRKKNCQIVKRKWYTKYHKDDRKMTSCKYISLLTALNPVMNSNLKYIL